MGKIHSKGNFCQKMNFSHPLVLIVLVGVFATGNALKCHQCESYTEGLCRDPFNDTVTNNWNTDIFLKECPNDGKTYFCRKIYQNVRGDERIIRSCGYEVTRTLQGKKRKNTQLYSKNIIPLSPPATSTGATAQLLTRFQ